MKKKASLILLSLWIASCGLFAQDQAGAASAKKSKCPRLAPVLLETVQPVNFSEYRHWSGLAQADVVAIVSPVTGIISEIKVGEGSLVDAGQELAVLNAGLNEDLAKLEQEMLNKKKILTARQNWKEKSERAIQVAEADYQKALTLLEEKKALANQVVKAPLAGMVSVKAVVGAELAAGTVLFEIVDPLHLLVGLPLAEGADGFLSLGEKLDGMAADSAEGMSAEIVALDQTQAIVRIANESNRFKAGDRFTFKKMKSEHAEAMVAPTDAIGQDSLGDFVYAVEKKRAKKLYVTIGASEAGRTMIEKGLVAGTQLIVSGFECLADKKKVRVVNQLQMAKEKAEAQARRAEKEAAAAKEAPKQEEKAEPQAVVPGLEEFIAYLEANKEHLGYDRYEKSEWKKLPAVKIFSGRDTQKKLLDVISQFAVSEMFFELQGEWIISTVAFKKVEAITPRKEELAEKEKMGRSLFGNRLKIGIHGSYLMMLGKNFREAYGGLIGFGGELALRFAKKMDFWVSGGMAERKAGLDWSDEGLKFSMIPLSAALRYYLGEKGKMSPFVGAGANVFMVKESSPTGEIDTTAMGFHVLGGIYYKLSAKLHGQFLAKFNMVKKDLLPESNLDDKMDLSGLELMIGLSYSL